MTLHQLAKKICAVEGKKQQVNIAQVKEILKCLVDLEVDATLNTGHSPADLIIEKARQIEDKIWEKEQKIRLKKSQTT